MTGGVPRAPVVDANGSTYSDEMADKICDLIVEGVSVAAIGRMDHMPTASTIFKWVRLNEEFRTKYRLARQCWVERLADEMVEIADDGTNDFVEVAKRNGTVVLADHEHMNRSRLRIDARRFLMAKLDPEKWGDKVRIDTGGDAVLIIKGRDDGQANGGSGGGG